VLDADTAADDVERVAQLTVNSGPELANLANGVLNLLVFEQERRLVATEKGIAEGSNELVEHQEHPGVVEDVARYPARVVELVIWRAPGELVARRCEDGAWRQRQ